MKKYIIYSLLGLLPLFFSCSDEVNTGKEGEGEPIQLSGMLTRAGESPRNDIYVKAFINPGNYIYFDETLAKIPAGLSSTDVNPIVFPGASPYYPFGNQGIQIIAYSGKAPEGKMYLTAGTSPSNDAVLSNYGKREGDIDDVNTLKGLYEPGGTLGSSSDPVELLQFRHVMTQLIVDTILDQSSLVDRKPGKIEFTLTGNGVVTSGRYPVRETEANAQSAVDLSSSKYAIKLGTNYLVPTNVNLVGQRMETLVIDDYTAKSGDLTNYIIEAEPNSGFTEMYLRPGYSYRLTLTISRLRLTGITLSKIDWQTHEPQGNLSYTPHTLDLDLGTYERTDANDTISKVVLSTQGNKQYIGRSVGGRIQFVTLPNTTTSTDIVTSVSLYTNRGLLINSPISTDAYTYADAGSSLRLELSRGGLLTQNGGTVSETNPYLVTSTVQFMNVEKELDAYYRQQVTVDLNTLNLVNESRLFNGFSDFTGSYDGNGNRIDGIDIEASGLFRSNSGTLKNIRLTAGTIDGTGQTYAGSIVGVNNGDVIACVNEARIANVSGTSTIQGGIVGQNNGRVIACVNTATILQGDAVGGIIGENLNTNDNVIVSCINTGALNPQATYLGYLCGKSTTTTNIVVRSSFGLVGSAQHVIGSPELGIGTGNNVEGEDVSAVEPPILRNELEAGETDESRRIINRLNTALSTFYPDIATVYRFVYDDPANTTDPVTGITWPAPVMN